MECIETQKVCRVEASLVPEVLCEGDPVLRRRRHRPASQALRKVKRVRGGGAQECRRRVLFLVWECRGCVGVMWDGGHELHGGLESGVCKPILSPVSSVYAAPRLYCALFSAAVCEIAGGPDRTELGRARCVTV